MGVAVGGCDRVRVGVAVPGGSADVILGAWTIAVEESCRERQGRQEEWPTWQV